MKNNKFVTIKTTEKALSMLKDVAYLNSQKQYEVLESLLDKELTRICRHSDVKSEQRLYKKLFGNTPPSEGRSIDDILKDICNTASFDEEASDRFIVDFNHILPSKIK